MIRNEKRREEKRRRKEKRAKERVQEGKEQARDESCWRTQRSGAKNKKAIDSCSLCVILSLPLLFTFALTLSLDTTWIDHMDDNPSRFPFSSLLGD